MYEDARMLPCLHRICRKCLLRQLNTKKTSVQDSEKSDESEWNKEKKESEQNEEKGEQEQSEEKQIVCSVCRKIHPLPERGIDGFAQDLRLQLQSQAAIHYAPKLENGATCEGWVSPHSSSEIESTPSNECQGIRIRNRKDAVSFCCSCHKFYCQPCTDHHKGAHQQHTLVHKSEKRAKEKILEKIQPQKDLFCTEEKHERYVLGFYCKTCHKLACYACLAVQHKDHSFEELTDTSSSHKQEMDECLDEAKRAIDKLKDAITRSKEMVRAVKTTETDVKEKIKAEFDKMEKALRDRKKELCDKVGEFAEQKIGELGSQRNKFEDRKAEIEEKKEEVATVRMYSHEEVVSLKHIPQARLRSVLEEFNTFRLDLGESDKMPVSLDAQQLADDIGRFGVITSGCSPDHSTVSCHIPRAVKGKERRLVVRGYNEDGTRFEYGGEDVAAELILKPLETQLATRPTMQRITPVDNGDGTYTVSFTPEVTGEYHLTITIRNHPIKGCPFTLSVREPRDYATSPQQSLSNLGSNNVYSLAIHDNGDIYVTQPHYIRIVNPVDESTRAQVGSNGSGERQFSTPEAIALRGDYMFIADSNNNRVQKISATGNHEFISQFGKKGSGDGEFSYPRGICLNPEGRIFVSDHNNNRVQVFEADGTFAYKIPQDNSDKAKVTRPWGLAFDHIGNLHVVSHGTNTIKVFTPEGKFLEEYGQGKLSYPAGITIDEEGYVIVAEYNSNRVQIFRPDSHENIRTLTGFSYPQSVVSSKEGFIYVGDRNNNRIQKY